MSLTARIGAAGMMVVVVHVLMNVWILEAGNVIRGCVSVFATDLLNVKEDAAVKMVSVENARTTAFPEPIVTQELAHVNMTSVLVQTIVFMENAA